MNTKQTKRTFIFTGQNT